MRPRRSLRIVQEGKFVLGAAAAGCVVGALAALLVPPLPWVSPPLSPVAQTTVRLAHGVGLGWWAGLVWGVFTVLLARSQANRPEVSALPALGAWAAPAGLATLGVAVLSGLAVGPSLVGAIVAALLATRLGLWWLARDRG